ncbi:hypothetical protein N9B19_04745, partial [Akkermansiaceae bacterium]|nr:hypothetical protein [Akkermansiaceae bacterium]
MRFIFFRWFFRFFRSSGIELVCGLFKPAGKRKLHSIGGSCKRVFNEFTFGNGKVSQNVPHKLLA